MVIRSLATEIYFGGVGRSVQKFGGSDSRSAQHFSHRDAAELGVGQVGAKLYSPAHLSKMLGSVELLASDQQKAENSYPFGVNPTLL